MLSARWYLAQAQYAAASHFVITTLMKAHARAATLTSPDAPVGEAKAVLVEL